MAKVKSKSAIGLEFTGDRINLVKLSKTAEGVVLVEARSVKSPVTTKEEDKKILVGNIIKAFEGLDFSKDEISLGIGGHISFVRKVKLPPVSHSKLRRVISFEVQQQVPFSLSEVIWDYQITSPISKIPSPMVVLIAAIKESFVDDLLEILRNSTNKTPDIVDTSALALHNCLIFNDLLPKDKIGMLINLGFSYTDVSIENNGEMAFTRAVPIGRRNILKKIAESKSVDMEKAEELLNGQTNTGNISSEILSVFEDLIAEIKRTTNYYLSQVEKVTQFQYAYTSGEFPKNSNFTELLKKSFRLEAKEINPFNKIVYSSDRLNDTADNFCISTGLALRALEHFPVEMNLLPPQILNNKKLAEKRMYFISSLVVLFLMGWFVLILGARGYSFKSEKLSIIAPVLDRYKPYMSNVEQLKKERQNITSQIQQIEEILKQKSQLSEILLEISKLTPSNIYIKGISTGTFTPITDEAMVSSDERNNPPVEGRTVPPMTDETGNETVYPMQPQLTSEESSVPSENKISLTGMTNSYPVVDEYIKQLRVSSLFKTVNLISVSSASQSEQLGRQSQPTASERMGRGTRLNPLPTTESKVQEEVQFILEIYLSK